jgi:hypothetical protein
MIVAVKLSGGLGNQLFQYAAGRALSDKLNAKLFFDKSFFLKSPNRKYVLDQFNIIHSSVTKNEIIVSFLNRKQGFFDLFKNESEIIKGSPFKFMENEFSYNKDFEILKSPVFLEGYWQSEKYFKNISEHLKSELTLRLPLDVKLNNLMNKIKSSNSVAIHLRRGDYIANKEINAIHGICEDDYYLKAMEKLKQTESEIFPLIFSDEIEIAINFQKKIGIGLVVSTEVMANDSEEFFLMSSCKHFIIANSTFSWWAAWLGSYDAKIVFAPRKWFNDESKNDIDLIPINWKRI